MENVSLKEDDIMKFYDRDSDGNVVAEYHYHFELLSPARIFQAIKMIEIHKEQMKNVPQTDLEVNLSASRESERHFFAAILCKKMNPDGYEKYYSTKVSSFEFLNRVTGKDIYQRLLECKSDFFYNTGMLQLESTRQLGTIMNELKDLTNGDQLMLEKILEAAVKIESTIPGESTEKTSTQTDTTGKHPENHTIGV